MHIDHKQVLSERCADGGQLRRYTRSWKRWLDPNVDKDGWRNLIELPQFSVVRYVFVSLPGSFAVSAVLICVAAVRPAAWLTFTRCACVDLWAQRVIMLIGLTPTRATSRCPRPLITSPRGKARPQEVCDGVRLLAQTQLTRC